MQDHINGYSLALFSLAQEEKKQKQYKEQAQSIIDALNAVEGYEKIMDSDSFPLDIRKKMVKDAFGKKVNKNLLNFLFVLVDRSKFRVAKPALQKLIKYINNEANINEGVVYSVNKLTPTQMTDLTKKTQDLLNIKLSLVNKIDKELISGFRIQVGDEVIEDNVSSRLEDIKNQLLGKEQ